MGFKNSLAKRIQIMGFNFSMARRTFMMGFNKHLATIKGDQNRWSPLDIKDRACGDSATFPAETAKSAR